MNKIRQGLGMALIFVAGMVTMVWLQAWEKFPLPVDFSGQIHPLWMFPVWVYPIAILAIGGIATLFLIIRSSFHRLPIGGKKVKTWQ